MYVHTTFMCVLHMCVWIGVVLGPGTYGMERFEGPSELHMCMTSRVKYQYQYVYQCSTGVYTTVLSTSKPKVESTYMYEYV